MLVNFMLPAYVSLYFNSISCSASFGEDNLSKSKLAYPIKS